MIYLKNNTLEQKLFIPRSNNGRRTPTYTLSFHGCVSNEDFDVNAIQQAEAVIYYIVNITLSKKVPSGEYRYSLKNSDGEEVAIGLARIGKYDRKASEQVSDSVRIIEYGG